MSTNSFFHRVFALCLVTALSVASTSAQTATYEPTPGQAARTSSGCRHRRNSSRECSTCECDAAGHRHGSRFGDGRNVIAAAKRAHVRMASSSTRHDCAVAAQGAGAGVGDWRRSSKATCTRQISRKRPFSPCSCSRAPRQARLQIPRAAPRDAHREQHVPVDGWEADASETVEGSCTSWCPSHLNIAPPRG